jgi:hypothetical protein
MYMPHYPTWDYVPVLHDFEYVASIKWPGQVCEQLDWITGITDVELWLLQYTGPKYQRWAWNMGKDSYQISVAFKYDKHRTLFLLNYAF